jgi:hypothetical protein
MSSFHIFIRESDGHNEIDVKLVDHVCDQAQGHDEASIFKICQLYIHRSKFYSPPDL